jgi:hypothetical protein
MSLHADRSPTELCSSIRTSIGQNLTLEVAFIRMIVINVFPLTQQGYAQPLFLRLRYLFCGVRACVAREPGITTLETYTTGQLGGAIGRDQVWRASG